MSRGPTDPNHARREFAARYASLEATAAFAHAFCDERGFEREVALRLALIVEELLSNTIQHGLGGESDDAVVIALSASGPELVLLYEDGAPPFDPLARRARATGAIDGPLEGRPLGGLGLRILDGFAAAARYAREGDRNRLWVTLRRTGDA